LYEGSVQLKDGAFELTNGLGTLLENGSALNDGAEQIFQGFIDIVNEQLKSREQLFSAFDIEIPVLTRDNYDTVLKGLLNRIGGAASKRVFDNIEQQVYEEAELAFETDTVKKLLEQRGLTGKALEDAAKASAANEKDKAFMLEEAKAILIISEAEKYVLARDSSLSGESLKKAVDSVLRDPGIQTLLIAEAERQQREAIENKSNSMMADPAVQKRVSDALPWFLKNNGQYRDLLQLKLRMDSIAVFCDGIALYTRGVAEAANGSGELYNGLDEVVSGLGDLSEGTSGLRTGANEFADGAGSFCNGANDLYSGMKSLDEGLSDYREGTAEFCGRLSVLDPNSEIGGLLRSVGGSEYRPVSFTDSRNNVSLVQFVMMTETIETEKMPIPRDEPEEKLTFLKRLLALFGL
jgi:putative membrane protein